MDTLDLTGAIVLILTDEDVLRLQRLVKAGAEYAGRLNGGTIRADVALLERLDRLAQQARNRLDARPRPSCATTLADDDTASESSGASWLTVSEAARRYRTSSTYMRRLAATGALKARRGPTGAYALEPASLEEWDAGRATSVRTGMEAA